MEAHPYAELFPMMTDDELQVLAADIKVNGQREDITTLDGMILDGRNRYRACEIAGVKPMTRGYLENDPLGFVISRNLHRRHLNESQRAMAAARIAILVHGSNQHESKKEEDAGIPASTTQTEAAAIFKVSRDSIQQARKVQEEGAPELIEAVTKGTVRLDPAVQIAKLPKTDQSKIVAQGPDAVKKAAKKAKAERKPTPNKPTPKPVDDLQFVKSRTNRISLHDLLDRVVQRVRREPGSAKFTIHKLREAIEKIEAIPKGNN